MMRIKVFLEIIEHPISLMHILNNILITDKSCLGLETKQYEKINGGSAKGASFNDQIRGAGYKIFFMQNGIVQALIILIGYMYIMKSRIEYIQFAFYY